MQRAQTEAEEVPAEQEEELLHSELQNGLSISNERRTSKYITRLQFHKHKHVASQTRAG